MREPVVAVVPEPALAAGLEPEETVDRRGLRGAQTAAIGLVTNYAFSKRGLIRVFAIPFTTNTASCRALEKVGYEREGLMRKSAIKDGRIRDQYLYAKVRG